MRNTVLYIFLTVVLPFKANAQVYSFEGTVSDKTSAERIPYANIRLLSGVAEITAADEKGHFSFTANMETVKAVASATGYKSDTLLVVSGQSNEMLLHPLNNSLHEVVVSASMRTVSKTESPIPVEVYSAALLKKNPVPTLFESMNMMNGIQPQISCNVCNTGDIHINGLEGAYTMVLIDGMPIVSALSTVYGLQGIPASLVKRIEVVKGPASTLYGSEAVAGIINVITRDALSSPSFKLDFSATSVGEFTADLSGKIAARKAQALLGFNYFNYTIPADINRDNFTDVTLQNRLSLFNKWDFVRQSRKKASLAFRYLYENRWGGEMQWQPRWRGSDVVYGETITTHRAELIGTYELPFKKENLRLDYSYNFHWQNSYYGTMLYAAKQHTAFAQLVWDKKWKWLNFLAGVPFRFTWYDDNSVATETNTNGSIKNKPAINALPGVFAQAEITPLEKLTILGGLRYDYHTQHGSIVTPRLSIRYAPIKNHTLRLTAGNGYRVVNLFTEDHAALSGAREVVIKEALLPEQSWNGNLNYNGYFNHRYGFIELDLAGFYTYFTNQIVADYLSDPQKIIYDNLRGHAVSRGVSATINASFTNGLQISSGVTYMNVYLKETNENEQQIKTPQLFAPAFSATYSISYTFEKAGLSIDWTGRINGPMHLPVVPNDFRPEKSPWHCLMNVQFTQKLPHRLEVYFGAKNLLNFIPQHPILRPFDPFDRQVNINNPNGYTFDPSYNYAPVQGVKAFAGVRWLLP